MVDQTAHDVVVKSELANIEMQRAARVAIDSVAAEHNETGLQPNRKAVELMETMLTIANPENAVTLHKNATGHFPVAPLTKDTIQTLLQHQGDKHIEDFVVKFAKELAQEGQRLYKGHGLDEDFQLGDAGKSIRAHDDNHGAPTAVASKGDVKLDNNLNNVNELTPTEAVQLLTLNADLFKSLAEDLQEKHGMGDLEKMKNVTIEILLSRAQGHEVDGEQIISSLDDARTDLEQEHLGKHTKALAEGKGNQQGWGKAH